METNKSFLLSKLSSQEVDRLIIEYRNGNLESAEKLLIAFKSLLGKYLNLMFHGVFNPEDRDITKFLSMCGNTPYDRTAEIVKLKLRRYDADEIVGVARIALLDTAIKYDNLYGSYKFVLFSYVDSMLYSSNYDDLETVDSNKYAPVHSPSIDNDWVRGITTGAGFSELSEQQRLIVKMIYNDSIPDIHVAKRLGLTVNNLKKEKEKIKDILSRELNINNRLR